MSETKEGRKAPTHMSHEKFYKLCNWVSQHAERLLRDTPSETACAAEAGKALGFDVPASTIGRAKAATGVSWRNARGSSAQDARERFEAALAVVETLREDAARQQSALDALRGLVHHLYHELGVTPPAGCLLPPKAGPVNRALVGNGR